MLNLAELASLTQQLGEKTIQPNETILIYGEAKSGKTEYAATIAKSPDIDRVFWFDGENGRDVLFRMVREGKLTNEEASKVILIPVADLPIRPYFQETITKAFMVEKDLKICQEHGRVNCPTCLNGKVTEGWLDFNLYKLSKRDCIVVDSGSQLTSSIMAYLCKGQPMDFKPGFNEYGPMSRTLNDILAVVQAATTNHVWITQQLIAEDTADINKDDKQKKDKFYPLIGTERFSSSVGKFFGTVIYLKKKMGKHSGGSSSTFMSEAITGSREGMLVEEDIGLQNLAGVIAKARAARSSVGNKK